jgi:hypothetical protein
MALACILTLLSVSSTMIREIGFDFAIMARFCPKYFADKQQVFLIIEQDSQR